ncbi:uncharacterized protein LOC105787125 [Gossypium raimondii]|uniref:uncharacterized protein LOC105787125 n=1 Tax=Gossypium raimondii TaxID=29730 RepID=UPI00227AB938|nr:uncharacterized protein LOC105787125 [Gossypium raimondii]
MDVVKDETKGESMFFIADGLVVMKGLPGSLIGKILFAETNEDFVDLLFSFLTIPFDSVLELLLGSNLTIGSISYLLQDLNIMLSITEPKNSKKAVLQPFYSSPKEFSSICSEVRFSSFLDPKSLNPNSSFSSGYVLKNSSFLVADDLVVKSLSSVSIISVLKELNIPLVDVEQQVISIGQVEVSDLSFLEF